MNVLLRFLWRGLLFSLPLLALIGYIEWHLFRTGDSWSGSRIAQAHLAREAELIFARGYFGQQFNVDKTAIINAVQPDIVVLGSSRVMQVRADSFKPLAASVYNGGGLLQGIEDLADYVTLVETGQVHQSQVIVIGIDPWWFRPDYSGYGWLTPTEYAADDVQTLAAHALVWRDLMTQRQLGTLRTLPSALQLTPLDNTVGIGWPALLDAEGFHSDGSNAYDAELVAITQQDSTVTNLGDPQSIANIQAHGAKRFQNLATDAAKVQILTESIQRLQAQGSKVYVFVPPFTDEAVAIFETDPVYQAWWATWLEPIDAGIAGLGLTLPDALAPADYGLDDTYMWDAIHPGEPLSGLALQTALQANATADSPYDWTQLTFTPPATPLLINAR